MEHADPPRPGLNFSNGRINIGRIDDLLNCGIGVPKKYTQKRWVEGNGEYYDDPWGNIWMRMVDGCLQGEIIKPALKNWNQLDSMNLPDYSDTDELVKMRKVFAQPTDKFKIASVGGGIFSIARYLRKMEVYFLDMAMYPEELKRLHAIIAKVYETKIHAVADANADGFVFYEDMGTQNGLLFSPDMWREYFRDEYTRLFGIAHDYGMKVLMHSCGKNWPILPDLLQAGVDCFQFDQPAIYDMPALAELLCQHKAALWSPVDIQKVLPTGNRKFIEAETRKMIEIFRGGLIGRNYSDLPGIGVEQEWDTWAYNIFMEESAATCRQ